MLNVYCRFICHHELNCDLFLSFPSTPYPLASKYSWVLLFFSLSKHDTYTQREKQQKQTPNPCSKSISSFSSNSTWCDRLNKKRLDMRIHLRNERSKIDEMDECVCVRAGGRVGCEWVRMMQRHAIILKSHSLDIKSDFGSSLSSFHLYISHGVD